MNSNDKAESIAEKARKSISSFCIEECKSYCCRKGYLNLFSNEVDLITNGKRDEIELKKILFKIDENNYSLFIGGNDPCPSLHNFKCMIYKKRPLVCKQFPLFIKGKQIRLSKRCLAVKQGMMYPYVSNLIKMGYIICEAHCYSDMGDVFRSMV